MSGARWPHPPPSLWTPRPHAAGSLSPSAASCWPGCFRLATPPSASPRPARWRTWLAGILLATVAVALCVLASDAPFANPAPAAPEFIFPFREFGGWFSGPTVAGAPVPNDPRPIHMPTALPARRTRASVVVRLEIDGGAQLHTFRPKGLTSDGQSVGELRVTLLPGPHAVSVSIATRETPDAPHRTWSGTLTAEPRRLAVLSYDPASGFVRG